MKGQVNPNSFTTPQDAPLFSPDRFGDGTSPRRNFGHSVLIKGCQQHHCDKNQYKPRPRSSFTQVYPHFH